MKLITFIFIYIVSAAIFVKAGIYSFDVGFASIYFGVMAVLIYEVKYIFQCLLRFWVWTGHFAEKYLKANKEFQ